MDYGTRYTDRAEKQLAARLKKVYTEAQKDLRKKVAEFTEAKKKRSAELLAKVSEGKMTMEQYREWERGQVFIGKQWQKRLNEMSQRLTDANKEAMRIIHDQQDDVFAENGNFELYQTEMHTGVSFDIYNKEAVNRLIKEKPELLPRKQVNPGKDKAWNQGVIANALTQSILQGESMDEVAARLARDTASSDYKAMMRYARTAMTAAQNEGRLDALRKTEDMGIKVVKVWIAVHDSRTRDAHRELDNEEKPVDKPFENDLGKIMCPGDPTAAPGNVYNCRCALGRRYLEYQDKEENPDEVNGVPYEVWKEGKKAEIAARNGKESSHEAQREKVTGSTSGIMAKTNRFNEKEHEINITIKKLEEEYSKLYSKVIELFTQNKMEEYNAVDQRMTQINGQIAKLRERTTEIQADRSRFLSESGEKDIMSFFGKIKGKHNAAIDAKSVNVITGDPRTQNNCAACVLAYDARRRGIDCMARISFGTNNGEIGTWWEGMKFNRTARYWGTDAREEIRVIANEWGEGARGLVQVDWSDFSGHTFAFEVINGRCTFIDPQTGEMNADEIFIGAKPGSVVYARTDDKTLTKSALFGLRGKDE